jgi:hypothetical protein
VVNVVPQPFYCLTFTALGRPISPLLHGYLTNAASVRLFSIAVTAHLSGALALSESVVSNLDAALLTRQRF